MKFADNGGVMATRRPAAIRFLVAALLWLGFSACWSPGESAGDTGRDATRDAADTPPDPITECEESASDMLSEASTLSAERDSNGYMAAAEQKRRAADRSVEAAAEGTYASAVTQAEQAGYDVCRTTKSGAELLIWQPTPPRQGRPVWAIRQGQGVAPVVLEAPHAYFDLDTLEEGALLFDALSARALIVSGTHRCANDLASSCSGMTGVCTDEGRQPYRNSDMAHRTDTLFQAVHGAIAGQWSQTTVISLHGFTDDGVSLSDGTADPTTEDSTVAKMATALESEFSDANITVCNNYPGATREVRLCGSTNVQGRHLNGSTDACTMRASEAGGRFIHMEQSRSIREAPDRVAEALGQVDFRHELSR